MRARAFPTPEFPRALAAAVWLFVVVGLFALWLAASGGDSGNVACESLGRAGERCAPNALATASPDECSAVGRGGRLCSGRP